MFKWIGAIIGALIGLFGTLMFFGYLYVQYKIDVFHIYIIEPVPPPGGYRTILEVPTSDWPDIVVLGIVILLGKRGAVLGNRVGQRLKRGAAS